MYVERFSLLETVARMENVFELFGYESIVAGNELSLMLLLFVVVLVVLLSCR